jgi:hypothetical protein
MASFKAFGRKKGPKGGQGQRNQRRFGRPNLELLESRRMLSQMGPPVQPSPVPVYTPTDTNLFDAQHGPMATLGVSLVNIYQAFIQSGGNTSLLTTQFPTVSFQNGMVGVQLKTNSSDFSNFVTQLTDLGVNVATTSSYYGVVEGYAPINALPTIAAMPLLQSGMAQYKPIAQSEYQGIAYNEAETSLFADVARTQFNVDGTGVTLGVLSDSVNQYNGGLAASYATGDLNPNNPVKVLQDDTTPPGTTDEGRAMLENIHDIAPGSNLQFATGFINELSMMQNIEALATAGSNIINDDIIYFDEPMFQPGFISQGVDSVVAKGVSYFSSAGNEGPDSGYLSQFRAASGNITGIGSGTFMNWNPSGTPNLLLPLTTGIANALITFQYDQPYELQEPAGSPGVVTSNVNIYIIDSKGNIVVGPGNNQNNVAVQAPVQLITIPDAGQYFVAVQVVSGPNPGHIEFAGTNDTNGAIDVSTQYGTAGGTSYPSTFGHKTDVNTIGVGATPWWAPAPYLGQTPLASEPFSSSGPGLTVFSTAGVPLASPLDIQAPAITAPDGGNTSFFEPGFFLNTSNPPVPGQPATSTNLVPPNQQNLPVFFGTSSATPNAAAVAALMLQKVPGLTPAQIRQGLIDSATAMNGAPPGYDVRAGYGLINAINAINAVDLLRVSTTNPANGATVTNSPSVITVTFNKPVNFSTILNAASPVLTFTSFPAGVTPVVGTPIAVDNPTDPTIVQWPFSFKKTAGTIANGSYTFSVQSPPTGAPVLSEDGKALVASGPIKFTLADTTAPVVTKTSVSGRQVMITFSKALDPTTVTLANILVLRQGTATTWPPTASTIGNYVNLNADPRATISYNPTNFTVTLNYSGLPQTELINPNLNPTGDQFAIVVISPTTKGAPGVTDLVGNPLDGDFNGSFPSGQDGLAGDFIQNLGFQALMAPIITTFQLTPTAANDTGIVGDQNTSVTEPTFVGQVFSSFPGTVANLSVYIQFGGLHDGVITLSTGTGGRGFSGSYDLMVVTDANGGFTFTAPNVLPEGYQVVQAVVVGQADKPPLPGYSSTKGDGFRIDLTPPQITSASFLPGGPSLPLPNGPLPNFTEVSSLTNLSMYAVDPVNPFIAPFGTPAQIVFDALNPSTAENISNYSLVNLSQNNKDESQYIATATFVPTNTVLDPTGTYVLEFTGRIDVTFATGLPAGQYEFIAHTTELQYPGITDAAGNPLNDITVPGEGNKSFVINFDVQPVPVYVTGMGYESTYSSNGSTVVGGPQSYYELPPASGTNTRDNVPAPPTAIVVDFSNPLPLDNAFGQPINYTQDMQLIASANSQGAQADGEFGNLGEAGLGSTGTGFTILSNYTVTLYNYNQQTQTSVPVLPGGSGNRLVLQLNPGAALGADNYRVYFPNELEPGGVDTRIFDIYNNQLDGENLGNQTSAPSPDFPTLPEYQDLLSSGVNRAPDMSGDGIQGGAFMTAFTVVNYGNVVFARPDYVENPLLPGTLSDGSLAKPYPVLAPEGNPNTAPANPNHNPNGGLNSTFFYQPGNFNVAYDRSGDGQFEQSALYAASQLSFAQTGTSQLGGPVVVVALPGIPQRNPITGVVTQATFSLQAPAGPSASINNGSASVPFDTLLAFAAGSTIKLQNASLFVQNQGAALQTLGTSTNPVNFTSYNDASIGGATNNNPDTMPHAGDWGGIVLRNYDEAIKADQVNFPVDGVLVGLNGAPAVSGADDAMSLINFTTIRYGGGAVPQGSSIFYSAITAFNARPMVTNDMITDTGGTGGTEAAIGVDMDSLREDDTARGILVRQATVRDNSLNAIYLMAEQNGFIEPTNAVPYPTNPSTLGGSLNYTLFAPLPYVVVSQLIVGQELQVNTGGLTQFVPNRLYIQPGVMLKFGVGSGLNVLNPGSSLNVGSRSYINGFDQNNNYSPLSPGYVEESAADPTVLFTTIHDDKATTTLVPNPINVTGEKTTPTLGPSMWGSVGIQGGGIAVINAATFQYGGGAVNTQDFTIPSQSVLAFITNFTSFNLPGTAFQPLGSHVYITNNNFFNNFDAAMQIEPDGLLAADPLRPLLSGHPFFRGNVMQGNGIDGMVVTTSRIYFYTNGYGSYLGPREAIVGTGGVTQTVDTVWDATDLTYVLKGTIILGPDSFTEFLPGGTPVPNLTEYGPIPAPTVSLTIQAALPGTLLANGETVPSPGQSVIVKMYNDETPHDVGAANLATSFGSTGVPAAENAGAGFILGVEDGVDPTPSPLLDPGVGSALRILGIPGNQTTGQQRVPVIITSLRDGSVGTTVRGVRMYNIWNSAPVEQFLAQQAGQTLNLTTPAAGDGGYIYIGGLSQTEYDPSNPTNGSRIDNANISYMSRIEVQGGGLIDLGTPANPPPGSDFSWYNEKNGYSSPIEQLNSPMTFTISDSNLNEFSDAAVFTHSEALNALTRTWAGTSNQFAPPPVRGSLVGEPVYLYMYNDTIANSGQGVHINPNPTDTATSANSSFVAVLVNNTFYNDPFAIQTISPQYDNRNIQANVNVMAMNNIFYGSSQVAVNIQGMAADSQLQYNLFYANATNTVITTSVLLDFQGNVGPIFADPQFVNAAAGNFDLEPTSPAIDEARSEIGPLVAGNAIYPTTTLTLSGGVLTENRTDPATLTGVEMPGRDLEFVGAYSIIQDPRQIVTLPGSSFFAFPDEWVPSLPTDPNGYSTPNQIDGTYNYAPIEGQRDILGFIRTPQQGSGPGFGSSPFMDIGAYQYVNLHPPEVTGVTETPTQGAKPVPFYNIGTSPAGSNVTPWTINVFFSGPIDPNTLNANTVLLTNLGSNPAAPLDQPINLSGKISYISDPSTSTYELVISLAAAGLTLPTDAYQMTLLGSGSPVVANPQGIALDGENTQGGVSSGAQLALPSGDGYPGGNFFNSFIINTTPPLITPGTLKMDPASDTNIVGDNITTSAVPTFDGTVEEPNATLVPVAGQTVILNVGITLDVNGVNTTYFDPSKLPASLSSYAQYIRQNAGTATSGNGGLFQVTVGIDGANTSLVTNTNPLPDLFPIYNVGKSGILSPLPGTDSGYYTAQVVIIDQSGNESNPNDPNAQAPFIVDKTAPTATFTSPTQGQVFTTLVNGQLSFAFTTNKNLSTLTAASIQLVSAGPDGVIGDADDVPIPINTSSIHVTLLNAGTGGKGVELVTFSSQGTLTNNLYQVTLLNSGANPVRDIAGNTLANPVSIQFAVDVPSLSKNLFVGPNTNTTPTGTRLNPYPTIGAAMSVAIPGDVIAVLPGVYTEQVTLKPLVKLYSASLNSTDATVFTTSTGSALNTVIRAPFVSTLPAGLYPTVKAIGVQSFGSLSTEIAGFTISSPLATDPAVGTINPNAVGIELTNSNVVVDKDYVVDGGVGILVTTSGAGAMFPQIFNDGIIGNTDGMEIQDNGTTSLATAPTTIINNDFAFNTYGLLLNNTASSAEQAYVASNIFWENHDQTNARFGYAIFSQNPNKVALQNNLFFGNGNSDTTQYNATNDLGNGFNPGLLGTTAAAAAGNLGNFVGNPAFVFPIDPRPGSDGPAAFFINSDYQIESTSAAIDNAWEATAIPTDLLGNTQVKIPGAGFGLPGYGPRDVGAFEFGGTGGQPIGGAFRVVTDSLIPVGGANFANGGTLNVKSPPSSITVTFSGNVNQQSLAATDLILSGTGVNALNPVHATGLTWIDPHTVKFNLTGQFQSGGTVNVSLPSGSVTSATGSSNLAYSDNVVIDISSSPTGVTPPPAPPPKVVKPPSGSGHHHHKKPPKPKKPTKHVTVSHAPAHKPKVVVNAHKPKGPGTHQG